MLTICVIMISFVIGFICGYGYLKQTMIDSRYRVFINGKEHFYKVHKTTVEKWADGAAIWECIDLKETQ